MIVSNIVTIVLIFGSYTVTKSPIETLPTSIEVILAVIIKTTNNFFLLFFYNLFIMNASGDVYEYIAC